jgi:hypothetical protein
MSFSIVISGHVDNNDEAPGVEQQMIADLRAVVAKHAAHITLASATFQYEGSVDLTTSDTDGTPSTGFVTKIEGETYEQYRERLVTYNASVPIDQQASSDITEDDWNVLPVG